MAHSKQNETIRESGDIYSLIEGHFEDLNNQFHVQSCTIEALREDFARETKANRGFRSGFYNLRHENELLRESHERLVQQCKDLMDRIDGDIHPPGRMRSVEVLQRLHEWQGHHAQSVDSALVDVADLQNTNSQLRSNNSELKRINKLLSLQPPGNGTEKLNGENGRTGGDDSASLQQVRQLLVEVASLKKDNAQLRGQLRREAATEEDTGAAAQLEELGRLRCQVGNLTGANKQLRANLKVLKRAYTGLLKERQAAAADGDEAAALLEVEPLDPAIQQAGAVPPPQPKKARPTAEATSAPAAPPIFDMTPSDEEAQWPAKETASGEE